MMIPYGYKQTEVGVIPEDWKCVPLLSKCSLLNGLTYNPENVSQYGLLVIRSSNIQGSHLVFSDNVYVDLSVDSEKLIKKDDIIVCVRNGSASLIGKCAKAENDYFATFGSFMAVLRGNCNDFIFQLLQQGTIQKHISKNSGATINQITNGDLKTIFIPFPSDEKEQYSIAEALSDVDGMISSLEKLIAKYKSIKEACLQHMFPQNGETVPRMRLPGFTDAWEQRKFEEIAVRSSVICSDDTLPRVEYEDIVSGTGRLNKDIYAKQSSKSGIAFHQGDVLYGKLRPYLQNWLLPTFDGLAVGDFWVLQPQNADGSFLYRLIQSRQFDEVANQSTGTKMPRADWKLVSKTVFSIPSNISEQAAIGTYFTALDSLITLHQRKLEKVQKIKQGMMQQLLTGKIRLV